MALSITTTAQPKIQQGLTSTQNQTEIRLGGKVPGWVGRSPSSIQGKKNTTLTLKPGTKYKISWTDLDGVEHRLQILDANGNILEQTKDGEERGDEISHVHCNAENEAIPVQIPSNDDEGEGQTVERDKYSLDLATYYS
ncbi:hypothetical protein [Haladaptatus sp. R4]|uniref:hypothetical protein n=1 Tax=Haladaptatus sp. R4 TaxID=1679489 RepID=UPI000B33514C|nr:hypothetical protein [Haladaptatus sp. R4]